MPKLQAPPVVDDGHLLGRWIIDVYVVLGDENGQRMLLALKLSMGDGDIGANPTIRSDEGLGLHLAVVLGEDSLDLSSAQSRDTLVLLVDELPGLLGCDYCIFLDLCGSFVSHLFSFLG